ncbi:helix-turn-helix domain-containing protein [Paenibacillus radicis (ex Xue et al. 2023)]|uniref:Helix-turn-helix domain-containing protein n=1 Tax=Paenibacillus radicis (ex Xue et al. 2023) TaxID=2972489 RepID=A0ABT1YI53_9BACL|nr:helix-turn-helix domain-containing protein [Paenibacillus radicis (ex Xue et al. 2023)]MCR8631635.1 helix-turn-helix domain-containing protein [Paenibacillus radicis (ex Xue et al. 2023)]
MNKRPRRYYIKLVVLCFIITSLPVIFLGIFSYAKSSGVVQQKVNEEKLLSLQQTQMNVEHTLKVVDQAATHFLGSKIILNALNEPMGPDQFQLFTQVKTELNSLQRLDNGISDIVLLSKRSNWLINNDGLYRLDAWMKSNKGFVLPEPDLPSVWEVTSSTAAPVLAASPPTALPDDPCQLNVSLIKKLPLTSFRSNGMAMIQIPACNLSSLFSVNTESESVLVLDESANLIVRKGFKEEGLSDSLKTSLAQLVQHPEAYGQFFLEVNERAYTVTYRKSEYNNWIYISLVTLDQLTKQSREIGWYTLYICIGLLLLFSILSWYGSKKLYRPIDKIYKDVAARQTILDTKKRVDEIQYIGEQVHSLFAANTELETRLYGQNELLRTFFIIKLFLGGMKEEEIRERMESFGMRNDFSQFCVLALQTGSLEPTRFAEKDLDLLLFAINNMIGELLPAGRRLQPIVLGHSQLTVITRGAESEGSFTTEVLAFAQLIQRKVNELLDLNVTIGISLTYNSFVEIPRAYEEAVEVLKRRTSLGDEAILYFGDLGDNHSLHYAYPFGLQAELFDAVKLVDRSQAILLLRQLLQVLESGNPNLHDLQFNAIRLLMNLLGLANGLAIQSIPMQRQQSLFDELFHLNLVDEGEEWFITKIIDPLMDGIEERTEVKHLTISREMIDMIHKEFDTDLTIDSCADRLHYNSSYLSTLFKKSMDISFSAYLAQYRHQVALKWLKETDMPIKDMAEKLRYNNPQNFIRSFRKLEGISPGKYRETEHAVTSGGDQLMKVGGDEV